MNNQQIFDKVLHALRAQGEACMVGTECMYRDGNGNACAVGHLLPDEHYTPEMEGCTVSTLSLLVTSAVRGLEIDEDALLKALTASGIEPVQYPLLVALQSAHDVQLSMSGMELWEKAMRGVALTYGLTYTPAE